MAGSGVLTAYLPGKQPDHVHSEAVICDGKAHTLSMVYEPNRVRLFVDGKQVADQAITGREGGDRVPGALAVGSLVEGGFGCAGQIDWVRISRGARDIPAEPVMVATRDDSVVGLWSYDGKDAAGTNGDAAKLNTQSRLMPEIPYDADMVTRLVAESGEHGNAIRGAAVFSDVKVACISCHKIGPHGGTVGPDLSAVAKDRQQGHIVESVLWPKRDVKPEFINFQILTVGGKVITGYKHSSDDTQVTLRDPATSKLTEIARAEIEEEVAGSTVMPAGLTAAMSRQQQLDLIRFLSDLGRGGQPLSAELQDAIAHSQMHGPGGVPVHQRATATESLGERIVAGHARSLV